MWPGDDPNCKINRFGIYTSKYSKPKKEKTMPKKSEFCPGRKCHEKIRPKRLCRCDKCRQTIVGGGRKYCAGCAKKLQICPYCGRQYSPKALEDIVMTIFDASQKKKKQTMAKQTLLKERARIIAEKSSKKIELRNKIEQLRKRELDRDNIFRKINKILSEHPQLADNNLLEDSIMNCALCGQFELDIRFDVDFDVAYSVDRAVEKMFSRSDCKSRRMQEIYDFCKAQKIQVRAPILTVYEPKAPYRSKGIPTGILQVAFQIVFSWS